jgi:hypothetical protein
MLAKLKVLLPWIYFNNLKWNILSTNPNAINLLKQHYDKISCFALSRNPNAIELFKNNQDKINWYGLSSNPSIFIKMIYLK